MFVARKIGRDALSIFLHAMGQQQGHWYATLLPPTSCNFDECHCLAFPSLSKLTFVDVEIIRDVLCQCGLYSVMPMVWVELIRENELEEVEVLHVFIMHKKRIYI